MKNPRIRRRSLTYAVMVVLCCQQGWAQQESHPEIEEIVVTAQKRGQRAQKVPISLVAFSEDTLRQAGVDSVEGLRDLTAGVEIISQSPGAIQVNIRGVTNLAGGQLDSTAAVGYYVDETPISSFQPTELPDVALWDVERVEMLRGPQGTLFGESSMGGTIRVITRKPDPSGLNGSFVAAYESIAKGGSGYDLHGILNVPLIDDRFAMRLNASRTEATGWIDIPDLGRSNANDLEKTNLRAALGWTPNDRLEMQFYYLRQEANVDTNYKSTFRGAYDPQSAGLPGTVAPVQSLSPEDNRFDLLNLTLSYEFDWASLISSTSYFDLDRNLLADISPLSVFFFGSPGSISNSWDQPVQILTQELRLASNNKNNKLHWTVGAFMKRNRRDGGQELVFDIPAFGFVDAPHQLFDVDIDSFAIFGQVDYRLVDGWAFQLGGRYYSDSRTVAKQQLTDSIFFGLAAGTATRDKGSEEDIAPAIGLSWTGDRNLFFARIAKGFRAGGINDNLTFNPAEIQPQYGPEELWSYELGTKNRFRDDRLQLNAYAYLNRWNDLQVTQGTSDNFFFTSNAGKAETLGTELELVLQATPNLLASANLSLVGSEIQENVVDSTGNVIIPKGNKIPFTPETTYSISVKYSRPMFADLMGVLHARYTYRAAHFSEVDNIPEARNDEYRHAFISVGLEGQSRAAYLSIDNLNDEENTFFIIPPPPYPDKFFAQPRTLRLAVQFTF